MNQIGNFSNEQMAGQRLMVGFDGSELNHDLRFLIDTVRVGGIILFSRNVSDPDQVRDLCTSVQDHARSCGQPRVLIAIDQEGGQVARLREPFKQFPGNPSMEGEADAIYFAQKTAQELADVGINMNMAPVMDVASDDGQSIMADRAFGSDPEWVAQMGVTVIRHLQENGIMAVAKHFPGIGRTILDSHHELPVFKAEMEDLTSFDLLPFEAAMKCGVAGMMLSHILYDQIDPEWPASLSPRIAKELLRERVGFSGVVITDDLDMGAIRKHYPIETCVRQILLSDIDIVLICHKGPDIETAFEAILRYAADSQEIREKGQAAVQRILRLKKDFGVIA